MIIYLGGGEVVVFVAPPSLEATCARSGADDLVDRVVAEGGRPRPPATHGHGRRCGHSASEPPCWSFGS